MQRTGLDSSGWSRIVEWFGGEAALDHSAHRYKAFIRGRGVKSAVDLLRLAFLYGPGEHSLCVSSALAEALGVADISNVALLRRLKNAADWLQFLCAESLSRIAKTIGAGACGRPIRIVDGSRIEGPGDRVWRLHLCYDAGLARTVDLAFTTTREGERLDRLSITPGEIRLGDRGFPQPGGIRNTLAAGADVLVRLTWNSLHLRHTDGEPVNWIKLFRTAGAQGSVDLAVQVHKTHGHFEPLPMRLVIIRKPPAAAAKARAKARRASSKNQRRTDPRTLAGADHIILLTSLDGKDYPVPLLGTLYRLRWQIELAIKRLKSILHLDRLRAKDPDLVRAWAYAHLLLAILLDATMAELDALSPSADGNSANLDLAGHSSSRRGAPRGHLAAA